MRKIQTPPARIRDTDVTGRSFADSALPLEEPRPIVASRFMIERTLGIGASGVVDLAIDLEDGRMVALKKQRADRDASMQRILFVLEAKALSAISHHNVVSHISSGVEEGLSYIAMEYVDGPMLHRCPDISGLKGLRMLLELSAQICEGLEALHDKGIVHRDIKPNNILVSKDFGHPIVKIIDLGFVKIKDSFDVAIQHKCTVGTGLYMAPEQTIRGRAVDQRADLFSLGVLMYEAVAGSPPIIYNPNHEMQLLLQREFHPTELKSLVPGIDPSISSMIMKALEKDPAKRFQSAKDMRLSISSCL